MRHQSKTQASIFYLKSIVMSLLFVIHISCKAQKRDSNSIIAAEAELTLVADGFEFTEGPAVDKLGNVYFTDQPNDRIIKWNANDNTVSDYLKPAGRSNGLYFDNEWNLLAAADEKNELWHIDSNKKVTVLINDFDGKKLNGPNDIWVDSKGGIYFTDPYYQRPWWTHKVPEQKEKRVYYLAKNTDVARIVADNNLIQPNGIIGTPDGKTLYIADIGDKKTYSYNIEKNGNLSNKKLFVNMGSDGMTIDHLGNVYLTGNGVTVFNSSGEQIAHIVVPENWTANVTFGGKNRKTLFITAMDSVYTLEMTVHGVR